MHASLSKLGIEPDHPCAIGPPPVSRGPEAGPAGVQGAPALADARWFPVDLNVPRREYAFLSIGAEVLDRSAFLDSRIEAALREASSVAVDVVAQAVLPAAAPRAWLFHTSFCCSTLLARMLHVPPCQVVLKEPLVLRRLSDARHAGWPLDGLVDPSVRLLSRPWDPCPAVVIKPTHAALNVAVELLDASPGSRGVILTSSLEDFLISNLKKPPETLAKVPALAERALQAGSFHARLPTDALAPPDLLAAVALQWAAQRELCTDIATAVGPQRLRLLDAATLLDDVQATAWQCAQWLRLPVPRSLLAPRVAESSQRHAKARAAPYDPGHRAADARMIRARFGSEIVAVLRWFDRLVMPAMRADALVVPAWDDARGTDARAGEAPEAGGKW